MAADVICTGTDADLLFTDVLGDTETSLDLVAQQIESAVTIAQGEWIVDATAGVDWMRYLTQKISSTTEIKEAVRTALADAPVEVDSIEVTHSGRTLSIVLTLRRGATVFIGTLAIDGTRDKIGNNGYVAAFFPQFMVPTIRSR